MLSNDYIALHKWFLNAGKMANICQVLWKVDSEAVSNVSYFYIKFLFGRKFVYKESISLLAVPDYKVVI